MYDTKIAYRRWTKPMGHLVIFFVSKPVPRAVQVKTWYSKRCNFFLSSAVFPENEAPFPFGGDEQLSRAVA